MVVGYEFWVIKKPLREWSLRGFYFFVIVIR